MSCDGVCMKVVFVQATMYERLCSGFSEQTGITKGKKDNGTQ